MNSTTGNVSKPPATCICISGFATAVSRPLTASLLQNLRPKLHSTFEMCLFCRDIKYKTRSSTTTTRPANITQSACTSSQTHGSCGITHHFTEHGIGNVAPFDNLTASASVSRRDVTKRVTRCSISRGSIPTLERIFGAHPAVGVTYSKSPRSSQPRWHAALPWRPARICI